MKHFNVLVTCAGGDLYPFLINFLKNKSKHKDIRVIAIDNKPNAIGKYFSDFFEEVPKGNSRNYIKKIKRIVDKYKVNLVIPGSDEEAVNLAKNRVVIEKKNTQLACIDYKNLKILSSKSETYKTLEENGFELPNWRSAQNQNQFMKFLSNYINKKRSFIIKPSSTRGGRDVSVIKLNMKTLKKIKKSKKKFLNDLQKRYSKKYPIFMSDLLYEPIFDLDLLAWKGKLIRGIVRRRVNPSDPNDGHIIEKNNKILNQGKKIVKIFNLSWLYDCDFMLDKKGNPVVIEINPRASGSSSVSIAAGVPLYDDLISLAKKNRLSNYKIPYGTKIIAYKSLKKISD